jgi:hypothetical protein
MRNEKKFLWKIPLLMRFQIRRYNSIYINELCLVCFQVYNVMGALTLEMWGRKFKQLLAYSHLVVITKSSIFYYTPRALFNSIHIFFLNLLFVKLANTKKTFLLKVSGLISLWRFYASFLNCTLLKILTRENFKVNFFTIYLKKSSK